PTQEDADERGVSRRNILLAGTTLAAASVIGSAASPQVAQAQPAAAPTILKAGDDLRIANDAIVLPTTDNGDGDWREQYAYAVGVQAYIYGFPYVYMTELRWNQVAATVAPNLPHMAVNHFWHNQVMGEPESQAGGSPNNDTLYSIAWLDLSKEPV